MMHWSDHLILLPIVLPLIVAAAMLLSSGEHRRIKSALSIATTPKRIRTPSSKLGGALVSTTPRSPEGQKCSSAKTF